MALPTLVALRKTVSLPIRALTAAAVTLPLAASANTGVTITSYGHSALLIRGGQRADRQRNGLMQRNLLAQSNQRRQGHGGAGCLECVGRTLARCCLGEEIAQQLVAVLGEHALGVELHPLEVRIVAMAQAHDRAVLEPGGDLQAVG